MQLKNILSFFFSILTLSISEGLMEINVGILSLRIEITSLGFYEWILAGIFNYLRLSFTHQSKVSSVKAVAKGVMPMSLL